MLISKQDFCILLDVVIATEALLAAFNSYDVLIVTETLTGPSLTSREC